MTESRQQRRARERAEAKVTTGAASGRPALGGGHGVVIRRAGVLGVELNRCDLDDDGGVWWSAVWGLKDDSVGAEGSEPDLQALVDDVIDDARQQWSQRYDLRIEWTIGGDRPPGQSVEQAIAAAGVSLPSVLDAPSTQ